MNTSQLIISTPPWLWHHLPLPYTTLLLRPTKVHYTSRADLQVHDSSSTTTLRANCESKYNPRMRRARFSFFPLANRVDVPYPLIQHRPTDEMETLTQKPSDSPTTGTFTTAPLRDSRACWYNTPVVKSVLQQ